MFLITTVLPQTKTTRLMISVKINNQFVDLFEDASLKYVFNSPAFSADAIVGDFSYSMSFPLTDTNKQIFNWIDATDSYDDTVEYTFELFDQNNFIVSGIFKVTDVEGKISGNLLNSGYNFKNTIVNKTTKDLDLGGKRTFANVLTHLVDVTASIYPNYDYTVFPILNEILFDGSVVETDWDNDLYINHYNPVGDYILFPYLAYVIDRLFYTFNYSNTNAIASHNELLKLVLVGIFRDPNPELYDQQEFDLVDHILKYDLEELLKSLNSTFCTSFFFDSKKNSADMIFNKALLTADAVDWTDKVVGDRGKNYSDQDPGFALKYEWDGTDETVSELQLGNDILNEYTISPAVLIPADLPVYTNMAFHTGEVRYVTCADAYYIIRYFPGQTPDAAWVVLTWNFFTRIVGDGLKERPSKMSTMGMSWHQKKTGSYRNFWMTPVSNQQLFSDPDKGIKEAQSPTATYAYCLQDYVNDFEPRVLFYRGMQPDDKNVTYPFGSSGKYNAKGDLIGQLTLNWIGSDGLYENFWKEWLDFIDTAKVFKFKIQLNIVDILNLDMQKQVRIENNNYLIKKISIDFPIKKAATVELVRI